MGLHYGTAILLSGSLGVLAGPTVARLLGRYRPGRDALLAVAAGASALLVPCAMLMPMMGSYAATLALGALAGFLYSLPQSLAASAVTLATPNRMRGVCSAVYVFIVTTIGLGVAPTIVALITDHVWGDPAYVGVSLAIVATTAAVIATLCLSSVLPRYRRLLAMEAPL